MLLPASSEFIALCRAQVNLLTQGLGAALGIVYLTEELTEFANNQLVPVVAYPEEIASWEADQILAFLSRGRRPIFPNRFLVSESTGSPPLPAGGVVSTVSVGSEHPLQPLEAAEQALLRQQQVILPLMHQEMVMGVLVTARADRPWNPAEQEQIQQISETLAIACVLDQRTQWLSAELRQQRSLREQKHDIYDTLLHQFRNPLTALRTFGKLLIKRLQAEDANRPVAEGIVRESDRLEELLKQLNSAVDLDEGNRYILPASPLTTTEIEVNFDTPPSEEIPLAGGIRPGKLLPSSTNFLTGPVLQLNPQVIATILDPLLASADAIAQDRQLTLQVNIPPALPPVRIDERALREVLNNLIDNALKYTPQGGQVYVGVKQVTPEKQAIVIADTGPGIPPQDLAHLFERHYRGVQAQTGIPGTGLGLAIARDLVQQMQGEIQVFSPASTSGLVPPSFSHTMGTAVVVWLYISG
jgi:hypothetical protein